VVAVLGFLVPFAFGLLAAIAIPAYQGYVDRAQQLQFEQQR
jgi:Tfp pilus assembly major pilin PilA